MPKCWLMSCFLLHLCPSHLSSLISPWQSRGYHPHNVPICRSRILVHLYLDHFRLFYNQGYLHCFVSGKSSFGLSLYLSCQKNREIFTIFL